MDLNEVHAIAWAVSVELLHNASLVHDDICDRDSNRRDQESVFRRFGPAVALCLGDFLIGKAYAIAAESDPRLTFVISQAISMLAGGQAAEFTRRGYPGLAEYKKIAIEKTAPMLGMPVLGNLVLSQQEHARRAVEHYFEQAALCYQIINDLNNFSGDDGANSPCSDLSLCRPNAVLACFRDSLHVNAQSRFDFWAEAVRAGKLGADAVETIEWSQQVKESTAFSTTFELLDGHFSEAERALATLQPCLQLALQPIHQWLRQHALRIDTAAFRPR
jgi:geranylgeranyl pyrophosphate synthase